MLGVGLGAAAVLLGTGSIPWPFTSQGTETPATSDEAASAPLRWSRSALGEDAAYEAFDQGKYSTALSLAEQAAGEGDPQAHALVARIYAEGLGVGKDEITAARWYALRGRARRHPLHRDVRHHAGRGPRRG